MVGGAAFLGGRLGARRTENGLRRDAAATRAGSIMAVHNRRQPFKLFELGEYTDFL